MNYTLEFRKHIKYPGFTEAENDLYKGAWWVTWKVPGIEWDIESLTGWGTAKSGGRKGLQRPVLRHFKTAWPVKNKELFKDSADVYAYLGNDNIELDWVEPVGEYITKSEHWHWSY